MPGLLPPPPRPGTTGPRFRPRLERLDDRITPTLIFGALQTGYVAATPRASAIGDFNGDGRPDIASANYYPNANVYSSTVSVLINSTPSGAVAPTFEYAFATYFTGEQPTAVAVGDVNGDGRADVVTANVTGTISVLLNTTAHGAHVPAFDMRREFAVGSNPGAVAVGDFNRDGRLDLAAACPDGVWVLTNAAAVGADTPSFAAAQHLTTLANRDTLLVADFTGDGRPDLVTARRYAGGISQVYYSVYLDVLTNVTPTGAGSVSVVPATTPLTVAGLVDPGPYSFATGDFDGDGRLDLTYGNRNVSAVLANRTVPGSTLPAFDPAREFTLGASVTGPPVVADFDGDGRADVAVPNAGNTVSVLVNTTPAFDPTPAFAPAAVFVIPANTVSMTAADFDADGRPDLATVYSPAGGVGPVPNVAVFPNASTGTVVSGPPLVGQFGTAGVWALDRTTGWWRQLTEANADALAAAPNGNMVASFGANGVWYYRPASGWSQINGYRAETVAIDGLGNVYASFDGFGTAAYRLANGWSVPLTSVAADRLAVNGSGDLAAHFPDFGLYTYTPATGWRFLHGYPITALTIAANGDVTVSFVGYGVNLWRPTADWTWVRLNNADATSLAAGADGSLVASFVGNSVGKYTPASGWQTLHAGTAAPSVAIDLFGNVFATLAGFGVYEFDAYNGWRLRTASSAGLLSAG